jgi:ATP-binding cassette subfamily F protein uup
LWIIWKNWVWKTTLVNMIMGTESIDSWTINIWETIVFGYYYQKDIIFPDNKRIIDVVRDVSEFMILWNWDKVSASSLLERFLFPASQQYVIANSLSWWEKRRLYLLTILIKNPNFLILDEPTNDLDLITLWILEDFLLQYKWCLIIISHDRFFMDRIVDHLFVFEWEWMVKNFYWNYSDYRSQVKDDKVEKLKPENVKQNIDFKNTELKPEKKRLWYIEKLEYEKLEKELKELEQKKNSINQKFDKWDLQFDEIQKLSEQLWEIIRNIESKELRWFELSEKIN